MVRIRARWFVYDFDLSPCIQRGLRQISRSLQQGWEADLTAIAWNFWRDAWYMMSGPLTTIFGLRSARTSQTRCHFWHQDEFVSKVRPTFTTWAKKLRSALTSIQSGRPKVAHASEGKGNNAKLEKSYSYWMENQSERRSISFLRSEIVFNSFTCEWMRFTVCCHHCDLAAYIRTCVHEFDRKPTDDPDGLPEDIDRHVNMNLATVRLHLLTSMAKMARFLAFRLGFAFHGWDPRK
jgi:hypothetical protein